MKYQVRFIVQGVMQVRRFDDRDKAEAYRQYLRASPEVDQVYNVEEV